MKSNYQKLREVIIKANPEKFKSWDMNPAKSSYGLIWTLADVLVALEKKKLDILVDNEGTFCKREQEKYETETGFEDAIYSMGFKQDWNLKKDNLDLQEDSTKQFLINLLV